MASYDKKYRELVEHIIETGTYQKEEYARGRWNDGSVAKALETFGYTIIIEPDEVPVLTTKTFFAVTSIKEMLLFWQKKTNKKEDFHNMGVKIWDKWFNEDPTNKWHNTIGPAYGWVLGQQVRRMNVKDIDFSHLDPNKDYIANEEGIVMLDQVDFLIQTLLRNPGSRRLVTSLWAVEYLDEMMLEPCVWKTTWSYQDGLLHLDVEARSNDVALGNPFNVYQYFVLHNMICQVTGLQRGKMRFDIVNPHIYDRHVDMIKKQILEPVHTTEPSFSINKNIKNFYEFDAERDFTLTYNEPILAKNYKYELSK